ncbi:MAG: CoA transferase [Pseudomonadales bacterium]
MTLSVESVIEEIWLDQQLPRQALSHLSLPQGRSILASSFHVGEAAQSSIAVAALAAAEIWHIRTGARQDVTVARLDAEYECTGYFTIDGRTPDAWAKISGLYACKDGHVRIHANFDRHRDGVLKLLGLSEGPETEKAEVEAALLAWNADAFETEAASNGLVVSKVRSFAEWDASAAAREIAPLPLFSISKISDAPVKPLEAMGEDRRPLHGIKIVDLTRILAGPVCGRTLACYGADVMLVNSPTLPNIEHIIDTSRGKFSSLIDLETRQGKAGLRQLLNDSDIFIQGYRPGGLSNLSFSPEELARDLPGLIYVSLSAYSHQGDWANRRGFDSLVQTAMGFNHSEAEAAGSGRPKAMPVQILDYASGFFMAFAAQVALLKRAEEGGSWHVQVSLAQSAYWLRSLGRTTFPENINDAKIEEALQSYASGFGDLRALPHAAKFSRSKSECTQASVPPGTHLPVWPS